MENTGSLSSTVNKEGEGKMVYSPSSAATRDTAKSRRRKCTAM